MHLVVVAVLVHVDTIERVDVASDLCPHVPIDKVLLIDESPITLLRIHEMVRCHSLLEASQPTSNGDTLVKGQILVLGVLDGVHDTIAGSGDQGLLLRVLVDHFEQPAVILADLYALLVYLHLVTDLIGATIVAIQIEVYEPCSRTKLHAHETSKVIGQGIADHRLVAVVGQESPALGIGKAFT